MKRRRSLLPPFSPDRHPEREKMSVSFRVVRPRSRSTSGKRRGRRSSRSSSPAAGRVHRSRNPRSPADRARAQ